MNEFEIRDEVKEKRLKIETFKDLTNFLRDVKNNYNFNPKKSEDEGDWYGAAPRVIGEAAVAVADFFSEKFGITGFQANFVMWSFIIEWYYKNNKTGLKLLNYDDMLYPQHEDKFDKKLKAGTWEHIQEEAKKLLEANDQVEDGFKAHPDVVAHWRSIADGNPPFGYFVEGAVEEKEEK